MTSSKSASEGEVGTVSSTGSTKASQLFNSHSHFVSVLHILSVGRLAKLDYTRLMIFTIAPLFSVLFVQGCNAVQDWMGPKPNVVFIMVDTLRPDRLGIYGHDKETSPNLDTYAAEGMVFERAYAHSGWTLPSTVSMMTGLYPHEHRVGRAPDAPSEFGSLPNTRTTMAEVFTSAGYRTMAVVNNTFLDMSL